MLGDKLGTLTGRVTGRRVIQSAERPTVEVSFEIAGEFAGVGSTMMGTYVSWVRPDGSLYGHCPDQGVFMTADGGMGTWNGAGVGRFTSAGGATEFRGAIYFTTARGRVTDLLSTAVVYEWAVADDGSAVGTFWAWS